MKRIFCILTFIAVCFQIYSQDQVPKSLKIGLYTNIGINQPVRFSANSSEYEFRGRGSYSAGVKISKFISENTLVEIASYYTDHKVAFKYINDIVLNKRWPTETFETFNIQVLLKNYFRRNYYLDFGSVIDFPIAGRLKSRTDTQSGFGICIGTGRNITLSNYSIEIAPNLEIHSLIPCNSIENQQRLFVFGIKIEFDNNCR
jgi:hypothetical protein